MKKKVITLLLSIVLASGSIGNVQVLAADTTGQEAEPLQEEETTEQEEESVQEEEPAEEANTENVSEDVSKREEEAEPVQQNEEQVQKNHVSETDESIDEEEPDTSEDAAAEVLETEETEITDESEDALADVVDSGSCGDDVTWTLTGTGSDLTLTFSGSGPMDDLSESSLPWVSNRAKVKRVVIEDGITSVGDYVCYSLNRMTEVSLPDSLTYIGEYGFANCLALKSVRIPGNVTVIYEGAFSGCSAMTSVTIQDGVTCIRDSAFSGCSGLTEISIPDSVSDIWEYAFSGCSSLTSINIPDSVSYIGRYAFSGCSGLKSLVIPDGITSIQDETFDGCSSLTSITIPNSVTYIGDSAFSGCNKLNRINIDDLDSWVQIGFDTWTGIRGDLYLNGRLVTEIVIPDGTTEITYGPFAGITSIKKVSIPESVNKIDSCAFLRCSSLTNVNIPDSVTNIGGSAFKGCSSLSSINIPDSVTSIGAEAFRDCSSLTNINIPNSMKSIEESIFEGCSSLSSINIPDSVTSIGDRAFYGCSSLLSINIPDSVESIGYQVFLGCDSLKSLTIPNSVTSIDVGAFQRDYWDADNGFVIFTQSPYVKNYCYLNDYVYFDKTAPSIAKITSHNGSDIRVYFEKRDEATDVTDYYYNGKIIIIGYQIKYADNKNMTGAKSIILKDKKAASKVITGLKNGKTYYVQIQHYLKYGKTSYWSKWSTIKSVTVGQTPYNTNVSKLSTYIGSHIKVDWTKTAGASGYHIKYADNANMTGAKDVMVKGNSTFTKTLTGLKNGKTYYVKIQTYRTVSGKTYWSSWSPAKSIKVDQIPYGSSIKKLTQESATKIKVTWDKAPSASGYHIQYRWYDGNSGKYVTKDIIINGNGTVSKTITGLKKNTDYDVRIQTFRKISGKTYWSSWSKYKYVYLWTW